MLTEEAEELSLVPLYSQGVTAIHYDQEQIMTLYFKGFV